MFCSGSLRSELGAERDVLAATVWLRLQAAKLLLAAGADVDCENKGALRYMTYTGTRHINYIMCK